MSGDRVTQAIPSFINGVSQQPPTMRLATQCEILENSLPTISDGNRKRPPMHHMKKLWDGVRTGTIYAHMYDRDRFERYLVVISNGDLEVFDLFNGGEQMTVAFPDGKAYLASDDPRHEFSLITVADYSFVVNKTVVTAFTDERSPSPAKEALAYVKSGYTSTTYSITMNDSTATYSTPSTTEQTKTTVIAAQLKTQLEGFGCVVEQAGSVLKISMPGNADFTFSVSDSWGEQALIGVKDTVAKFTDLPAKAFDGFRVRVTGESKGKDDDYYVEYNSEGGTRTGTWDECRGWDLLSYIDGTTMPHALIREADGTFTFKRVEWEPAKVGDDISCPPPAFLGTTLSGIVFHRNRLGIIADENVVFSRDADFFNFWPKTASTVVATDAIDYAVSYQDVSLLRYAVPFREALILFSDKVQFELTNGGQAAFSPETVRCDPATSYNCSPLCPPVLAGQNIYFVAEDADNATVMEYFVTVDGVTLDAVNVSAHAPRYAPKGVFKLLASTNDDFLLALSANAPSSLWLYKYFWIDEDKVQSAWSEWMLPETDAILSVVNAGYDIYPVIQRADGVYLEHLDIQSIASDPGMIFQVMLDRKIELTGTYDDYTNKTTWTLPYNAEEDERFRLILGGGFTGRAGRELVPEVIGNTAAMEGRYDQGSVYAGRQYSARLRFSQQFVRESKEVAAPVITDGHLQLLKFTVLHRNSGYFRSEVHAEGRKTQYAYHLGTIGDGNFRIGSPVIDSRPHTFYVMAAADRVEIDIINDRHFPSALLSAEWTGLFTHDANRI